MRAKEFLKEYDNAELAKTRAMLGDIVTRSLNADNSKNNDFDNSDKSRENDVKKIEPTNKKITQNNPKQKYFSTNNIRSLPERGQYDIIFSENDLFVVEPRDAAALKYWSLDTYWPTTKINNQREFQEYIQKNTQPWIVVFRNVRGPTGKYLMHLGGGSGQRQTKNFKNKKVGLNSTFEKYKNFLKFVTNSSPESELSFSKISDDLLEPINKLVQRAIRYLAKKCITKSDYYNYLRWRNDSAKKFNISETNGRVNMNEFYKNSIIMDMVKKYPVANFYYVVDKITNYSASELREIAKIYQRENQLRFVTARKLDSLYVIIIKRELGRFDFDLAHLVDETVAIHKGSQVSAYSTDSESMPETIIGTTNDYTVFVRKHDQTSHSK